MGVEERDTEHNSLLVPGRIEFSTDIQQPVGTLPHLSKWAYKPEQGRLYYINQGRKEQGSASLKKTNVKGGGKGWTACTATGTNICAGNSRQIIKQTEGQENEGSWSIFKQDLIITMNMHCFPRSSRYANMRWIISQSKSPGSSTLVCMDTHRVNTYYLRAWHLRKCVEEHPSGRQPELWRAKKKNLLDNANVTAASENDFCYCFC